jgi:hypothetical protein
VPLKRGWILHAVPVEEDVGEPGDRVIIMPISADPRRSPRIAFWHALLEGPSSPSAPLGEFDGSREDALAWARATGARQVLIYDLETGDLVEIAGS